jgi:hypothetical protein
MDDEVGEDGCTRCPFPARVPLPLVPREKPVAHAPPENRSGMRS